MAKLANFADFELPPEGRHPAALVRFIDIGLQSGQFGVSRQADLAFELADVGTPEKPVLAFKRVFKIEHVTNDDGNTFANVECKPIRGAKRSFKPVSELLFLSLQPGFEREGRRRNHRRQPARQLCLIYGNLQLGGGCSKLPPLSTPD